MEQRIFVWKASLLLELMQRYQPKIAMGLEQITKAARGKSLAVPSPQIRNIIAREYKRMPNISIDYAVLEKAGSEDRVITLEADFGWSDVGSWAAVHRMLPHDENGNAGNGKWLTLGAKILYPRSGPFGGLMWKHAVDTPDALLVGDIDDRKRSASWWTN